MASPLLTTLLLLLISAAAATTRIPLSTTTTTSTTNPSGWRETVNLASRASLTRAHHLKRGHRHSPSSESKTPANPRSYGGYSITLTLGTPPQPVTLVLDTGSSLVWTPCTTPRAAYTCRNCSFSGLIFTPNASSTSRPVHCDSPQCRWVFGPGLNCKPEKGPTKARCPFYQLQYGLGDTAGELISDSLRVSKISPAAPNFLFGCSFVSDSQPEGIAGFGRGPESIPAQLRLTRFSYCLASHRFDDEKSHSGELVLYKGRGDGNTDGVSYAPFVKSPAVAPYNEYYYVSLSKVIVGGNVVRIPPKYLVASAKGNGGVIVDSGSTFTYMERAVFDPVAKELEKQMSKFKRAEDVEEESGLGPCYNVTGQGDVEVPKLVLLFTGGARMDLPLGDYFEFVNGPSIACMTVLTDPVGPVDPGVPSGPAVILGNNQQQNFYVEFDLERQRFGFKAQQCDRSS